MEKRDEKLESTYVLPLPGEVFLCEDPCRLDIWDKPMDNVHIEVRSKNGQTWYYCYGDIDCFNTCFGAELTLEGAYQVIKSLIPADLEHQQIKEESRQAYLNGGRTPYLYDIDGNEYYTTRDGVRHYTRVEG